MNQSLKPLRPADFETLVRLSRDGDLFTSQCGEANLAGQVFGGQLMTQALVAAAHDVPSERRLCSVHATFLRSQPLEPAPCYSVRQTMEGRTFSNRDVETRLNGKIGFRADFCFQRPENGLHHSEPCPDVPQPENLAELHELAERHKERLSTGNQRLLNTRHLYELKPVDDEDFLFCTSGRRTLRYWARSSQPLPDDPRLHEAALLFISDAWINSPMLLPHIETRLGRDFFAPTLSHDMWLHRPPRADDWLLFDLHSPSLQGATGLTLANIFDRAGQLIASVAQHALFRQLNDGS
jgi:acyl-CoA thioesterase II